MNKDFYPTPKSLISRMISKVKDQHTVRTILEPSAGDGAIVDYIVNNKNSYYSYKWEVSAIEIDEELQSQLLRKRIRLIDSDFLSYHSIEHFDLLIANFPFSDDEDHALKALDTIYSGQLVFLMNAETLKNPFSNKRKMLVNRLQDLGADIEYIQDAFTSAVRKTNVDVALVYVDKRKTNSKDIVDDIEEDIKVEFDRDIQTKDDIHNLVISYNKERELVLKHIVDFYKNYNYIKEHLYLSVIGFEEGDVREEHSEDTLVATLKQKANALSRRIKSNYWSKVMQLDSVSSRLTSERKKELSEELAKYLSMEFTEENVRRFVANTLVNIDSMIKRSIEVLFDKFTAYALKDVRWGKEYEKSVHYFNAWKGNKGYKVADKVIMPFYHDLSYGTFRLSWDKREFLEDLNITMRYFSKKYSNENIYDIVEKSVQEGKSRKIETDFFFISIFKKGTIHIEFKDKDMLRDFNIAACKLKKFLPMDYAEQEWENISDELKDIANNFEGGDDYKPCRVSPTLNMLSECKVKLLSFQV